MVRFPSVDEWFAPRRGTPDCPVIPPVRLLVKFRRQGLPLHILRGLGAAVSTVRPALRDAVRAAPGRT